MITKSRKNKKNGLLAVAKTPAGLKNDDVNPPLAFG
jgi:hypothetical protein